MAVAGVVIELGGIRQSERQCGPRRERRLRFREGAYTFAAVAAFEIVAVRLFISRLEAAAERGSEADLSGTTRGAFRESVSGPRDTGRQAA